MSKPDHQLNAEELQAKYEALDTSEGWAQHPRYEREDWQHEAAEGNTQLGYWDWVMHALEAEAVDEKKPMSTPNEAQLRVEPAMVNTLLAALRFYQEAGMGDPCNRSDHIHALATDDNNDTSLDDEGIDELCEALNCGDLALMNPRVSMPDWRPDDELPPSLKGKTGSIDISKIANGDIEITSPLGEKTMFSLEFDAGVSRIHVYPPDAESPTEYSHDEFAVTIASMPGEVLVHNQYGNGFLMQMDEENPVQAPYYDGDERLESLSASESMVDNEDPLMQTSQSPSPSM
ncbi:hypothetical protein [Marinobacterium sp. BA1]|uniref:hypothetical protein n=1 Tax=Marinobacterium sp. BA1 TaxID=3138931 RepID=UPI0032E69316